MRQTLKSDIVLRRDLSSDERDQMNDEHALGDVVLQRVNY